VKTLERVGIATVGYEGRTADELVELVSRAGVSLLVDVRLTPISRKPGLSKNRLADALRQVGVDYWHLPVLGNPRDNRDAFRRSEDSAYARFRSLMDGADARAALDLIAERTEHESIALLCFERDSATCHRSLVIQALQERDQGLAARHL
jgi:uncharacterized protein (DUF488 family)